MKQIFFLFAVALLALGASSCQQYEVEQNVTVICGGDHGYGYPCTCGGNTGGNTGSNQGNNNSGSQNQNIGLTFWVSGKNVGKEISTCSSFFLTIKPDRPVAGATVMVWYSYDPNGIRWDYLASENGHWNMIPYPAGAKGTSVILKAQYGYLEAKGEFVPYGPVVTFTIKWT